MNLHTAQIEALNEDVVLVIDRGQHRDLMTHILDDTRLDIDDYRSGIANKSLNLFVIWKE